MSKKITHPALLALLLIASSAQAGWYEITNYVGTIGTAPVHVSLQTFGYINRGDKSQWRVDGSYYYDAHRIPIPLQGKRQADGSMQLCEATAPRSNAEAPAVSEKHPVPCPITLTIATDSASGEWNGGKKTLPIALRQVGSLNNTGDAASPLSDLVEIPMWHQFDHGWRRLAAYTDVKWENRIL